MRTSLYSILCIVVRLGAVLLFAQTVVSLPGAWEVLRTWEQSSGGAGDGVARVMLIGFGGALIALAIALWLYPGLLARLASGSAASREVFESPIGAKDLQYIALSVLGIVFAVSALLGLVAVLFRIALSAQLGDVAFTTLAWQNGASLLVQALELTLGVGLTFGARGLTGLLYRLRERGLPPAGSESGAEEISPSKE